MSAHNWTTDYTAIAKQIYTENYSKTDTTFREAVYGILINLVHPDSLHEVILKVNGREVVKNYWVSAYYDEKKDKVEVSYALYEN